MILRYVLAAFAAGWPVACSAQTAAVTGTRGPDQISIGMFLVIVIATLIITWRSAGRTKSKAEFYTAGHAITPLQNGLAIAGDFLSAAAFLGISALVYASGFDGLLYALGFLTGWPIVLFLMSERMRNLGSYTFADAAAFRLDRTPHSADRSYGKPCCCAVLSGRADDRRRQGHRTPVRSQISLRRNRRRRLDDPLRHRRRHAGDNVGPDHEGGAVVVRRNADGDCRSLAFWLQCWSIIRCRQQDSSEGVPRSSRRAGSSRSLFRRFHLASRWCLVQPAFHTSLCASSQ